MWLEHNERWGGCAERQEAGFPARPLALVGTSPITVGTYQVAQTESRPASLLKPVSPGLLGPQARAPRPWMERGRPQGGRGGGVPSFPPSTSGRSPIPSLLGYSSSPCCVRSSTPAANEEAGLGPRLRLWVQRGTSENILLQSSLTHADSRDPVEPPGSQADSIPSTDRDLGTCPIIKI